MAKGLRSKIKQKNKRLRKVKFAERETEKIKLMVESAKEKKNVEMKTAEDIFKDATPKVTEKAENEMNDAEMKEAPRNYDPVTFRDENGRFPPWLSSKQRKKLIGKKRRIKRKKN